METVPEIKVFISHRDSVCDECGEKLGRNAWITLVKDKGALCLSCAELDHLVFLAPGDAALTRRARAASPLSAIVLKWSRSRKRYERQGIIVQEEALAEAEKKCLDDSEARARRRERQAARRGELDSRFVESFAARVREIFPGCPSGVEQEIADHACQKYSGRVGRSASAKALEEEAIRLAVIAHIRHAYTGYDTLLGRGVDRLEARALVSRDIAGILRVWEGADPEA